MIIYYLGEFAAALVLAALEGAWAPWLRLHGQPPGLVVALVVLIGLIRGPQEGVWTGLVGALCLGSLNDLPLGGLFLGYMGCGLLTGFLGGQIFPERMSVLLLVVALAVLGVRFVSLIFTPPPEFAPWLVATLLQAVYTAPASLPLAWLARLLLHRPPGLSPPGGMRPTYLPRA